MINKVSIIICCYNSAQKLQKTLEHLANQRISDNIKFEVVVVDNASIDNTGEVAKLIWEQLDSPIPLRVVSEKKAGLVYARICGVKTAKHDLLIFCDDDNWLREDYVQNAVDIMNNNPTIGVLGGQSVLAPHIEAPEWWEEYQGNYAVGKQLTKTGLANHRGFLYGAGMVTYKSLAERIFDSQNPFLLVGRKGNICLSGEDGEYCQRAMLLGYNLYYSESLFYWHDISVSRLSNEYLEKLLDSFEPGMVIIEKYRYISKYYRLNYFRNVITLVKRLLIYTSAKQNNRDRKLYLLRLHANVCRCSIKKDNDVRNILKWIQSVS